MRLGDERIRTADILLAKQALYQLSYVPAWACFGNGKAFSGRQGDRPGFGER
jgi:hypothetical protein